MEMSRSACETHTKIPVVACNMRDIVFLGVGGGRCGGRREGGEGANITE